jgi:hypothetical protein
MASTIKPRDWTRLGRSDGDLEPSPSTLRADVDCDCERCEMLYQPLERSISSEGEQAWVVALNNELAKKEQEEERRAFEKELYAALRKAHDDGRRQADIAGDPKQEPSGTTQTSRNTASYGGETTMRPPQGRLSGTRAATDFILPGSQACPTAKTKNGTPRFPIYQVASFEATDGFSLASHSAQGADESMAPRIKPLPSPTPWWLEPKYGHSPKQEPAVAELESMESSALEQSCLFEEDEGDDDDEAAVEGRVEREREAARIVEETIERNKEDDRRGLDKGEEEIELGKHDGAGGEQAVVAAAPTLGVEGGCGCGACGRSHAVDTGSGMADSATTATATWPKPPRRIEEWTRRLAARRLAAEDDWELI